MGVKAEKAKRVPSPSLPLASETSSASSSEASSSRSTMQSSDSEVDSELQSQSGQASSSNSHDDSHDDEDMDVDSDDDSRDSKSDPRPDIDLAKARSKLHHVAKTLRATAKKTKTFEVQKLVKKLKGLHKKDTLAEQAKLAEAELAALKSIDINLLAGRALVTKMVKAKLLPKHAEQRAGVDEGYAYLEMVKDEELLGEEVLSDSVVTDGDKALERAKAKITSSKVLADFVGKFVDELKKLVGIEPVRRNEKEAEVDVKGKGKAKQEDIDDDEEGEREWSGSGDEEDSEDEEPRRLPLVDDDHDEEAEADEEELERLRREKLAALGDLSQWDDMIGSDSAVESGSDNDEGPPRKPKQKRSRQESDSEEDLDDESEDDSDSDSDSDDDSNLHSASSSEPDSDSDSDASSTRDRPSKRKSSSKSSSSSGPSKKKSKSSSSSSTFLPSLSTGFIAGRSDDEWSDAEADLADRDLSELKTGGKKERKNRMGQRARKALYEKKYGKNANHIKMREKRKAEKAERAAARPSAAVQGGRQRPPAFQAPSKRDGGWGGPVAPLPKQAKRPFVPRDQPAQPQAPVAVAEKKQGSKSAADKAQEMHPSWIAKQKQKELMAQVKPQGKKVVFD